jgi:hypothetical protein
MLEKIFQTGPIKMILTFKNRCVSTDNGCLPAIWLNLDGDFGTMLLTNQG